MNSFYLYTSFLEVHSHHTHETGTNDIFCDPGEIKKCLHMISLFHILPRIYPTLMISLQCGITHFHRSDKLMLFFSSEVLFPISLVLIGTYLSDSVNGQQFFFPFLLLKIKLLY